MTRTRTMTIGRAEFAAFCPAPRDRIGFWEAITLTVRGWWDAVPNRDVAGATHTHTLHWLQSVHRRRELEVVRAADTALSTIDLALAACDVTLAGEVEAPQAVPTSRQLTQLEGPDRGAWAAAVRSARTANARAEQTAANRDAARRRREELLSVRAAIVSESEVARHKWREAYDMRAARYTRARFGRRVNPGTTPAVAAYARTEGPTPLRRP